MPPILIGILAGVAAYYVVSGKPLFSVRFTSRDSVLDCDNPLRGHTLNEYRAEIKRYLMELQAFGDGADPGWLTPDTVLRAREEFIKECGEIRRKT